MRGVEKFLDGFWLSPEFRQQLDNGGDSKPPETGAIRPQAVEPKGRLLFSGDPKDGLWLFEEEIPREGTRVDRLFRYARWQNGRTSMWTARRRSVGSGEGSSGLRFDVLDPG